jgi:hypothetical protein
MSKQARRGHSDDFFFGLFFCLIFGVAIGFEWGRRIGWNSGVRETFAGDATVISKPDGTTEAVKVYKSKQRKHEPTRTGRFER